MSLLPYNQPNKTSAQIEATLEVLLIRLDNLPFALRARQVSRLQPFNPAQLLPAAADSPAYLRGLLGWRGSYLPLLDLAMLLGLVTEPYQGNGQQVLVMEHQGMMVGFLVQSAQQIERLNVTDLRLLPPLVEQNLFKPVVWALWKRSDTEIVPLLDPRATLTPDEWQNVVRFGETDPFQQIFP